MTGTMDGDLEGGSATHKAMGVGGVSIIAVDAAGKITSERRYWDPRTMKVQAGIITTLGARDPDELPTGTASFTADASPRERANLAAAASWTAAFDARAQGYYDLLADDVVLDNHAALQPLRGRDAVVKFTPYYWRGRRDIKKQASTSLAIGDYTITELANTFVDGPYSARKQVTFHELEILEWHDGKITRGAVYTNTKELD
jgi:hypothetical protein